MQAPIYRDVAEIPEPVDMAVVGANNDDQFGPVVLPGIGGTGVELYGDTAIRLAPPGDRNVAAMARRNLLEL